MLPLLLLLLCLSAAAPLPSLATFCSPESRPSCWPSHKTQLKFAKSLSKHSVVYTPDDPLYLGTALVMNELKSNFPGMVVMPASEEDVVKTVVFAAKHRIRLVARCSGHDYNDRSTGKGILQLNTQLLKTITYNHSSTDMTVGAGCNFNEMYKFADGINRGVVGGQSKTVCLAGYLMGGGHSNLTPLYGLGVDSVVSMRFVLYNGTILTLKPTGEHSDLFNAVLGSGHSTYGVLTSVVYNTIPPSPKIIYINALWKTHGTPSVMDYIFNITWFNAKPNNLVAPYVQWGGRDDSGGLNPYTQIKWIITYPDYQVARDYLQPLFDLPSYVPAHNTSNGAQEYEFTSLYDYAQFIYGKNGSTGEIWERKFLSNVMLPFDQALLDKIKAVTYEQSYHAGFNLLLVHGGVSLNGTVGSAARGLRHSLGELAIGDQWMDPGLDVQNMKVISEVMGAMSFLNASYNNEYTTFHGMYNALPDWKTRFYEDYEALLKVKTKYDPCNLYVVEYGVASDLPTATC